MAEAARKLATYEDLLALPEDVRAEVIGGQIVVTPSPLPEHGWIQLSVGRTIGGPFDVGGFGGGRTGPGGWWILAEVDVRLSPHDIVRPDVAGWRRQRLPDPWGKRPIDVVPDWVCEILSPATARYDRGPKMRLYVEHGVGHCWLIDPTLRTLEAYAAEPDAEGRRRWVRLGCWAEDDEVRLPPFEAEPLRVGLLFPPRSGASQG